MTICVRCRLNRSLPVYLKKYFRYFSSTKLTNEEVRKKRNEIFENEKTRQLSLVRRVEKIEVQHKGVPQDCTLIMNKHISTPYNCAMHIGELLVSRSVVALVNDELWDIHRPLTEDCTLKFLHFKEEDPRPVNNVFWKSCSFILGHILETAFNSEHYIELCSFPPPDVKSGSFVYDVDLKLPEWKPNTMELNCLSRIGTKLSSQNLPFECLDMDVSLAVTMFEDNRFKREQIPRMASEKNGKVRVYRMGEHTDVSCGPMISNTNLLGRFRVTAVHDIETKDFGTLQRVQGLSIPYQLMMHYWTFEFLAKRAMKKNDAFLPSLSYPEKLQTDTRAITS